MHKGTLVSMASITLIAISVILYELFTQKLFAYVPDLIIVMLVTTALHMLFVWMMQNRNRKLAAASACTQCAILCICVFFATHCLEIISFVVCVILASIWLAYLYPQFGEN